MTNTPHTEILNVKPTFKLVFLTVSAFTLLTLIITIGISFVDSPSELQRQSFELSSTLCKCGFGAIVGLLGGKVT